jgi:hypothetical protein
MAKIKQEVIIHQPLKSTPTKTVVVVVVVVQVLVTVVVMYQIDH